MIARGQRDVAIAAVSVISTISRLGGAGMEAERLREAVDPAGACSVTAETLTETRRSGSAATRCSASSSTRWSIRLISPAFSATGRIAAGPMISPSRRRRRSSAS